MIKKKATLNKNYTHRRLRAYPTLQKLFLFLNCVFFYKFLDPYEKLKFHFFMPYKRRWVDNIKMDLQEVGCGYMD